MVREACLTIQMEPLNLLLKIPVIERFLSKINIVDSCWEWTAFVSKNGYGTFWFNGKSCRPHRFIYEYYHGMICPDLVLDHLCRNRKCVNPIHLEQVTQKENVMRGIGLAVINFKKTYCKQGHEFTEENTYVYPHGKRECRICNRINCKNRRLNLKKLIVGVVR